MPVIQSNGISLAYEALGNPQDPPLLLIMGLGMQMIGWPDPFCAQLAGQGFYVIRFDNRDSGLSTKMDQFARPNLPVTWLKSVLRLPISSAYTLDDMARDTVGLLDALGIARAHVVGASMGGMIAQIVAARYPQRVRSLVSIMSTSGRRGLPGPTAAARMALMARPPKTSDVDAIVSHLCHSFRVIGSPAYPVPDAILRQRIATAVRRNVCIAGVARQLVAITASGNRVKLLKSVTAPTLVIHGSADPLVPVEGGRDTAQLIAGAELAEIAGMGHDFPPALDTMLVQMIAAHCLRAS